jgi:hypothetical protein
VKRLSAGPTIPAIQGGGCEARIWLRTGRALKCRNKG